MQRARPHSLCHTRSPAPGWATAGFTLVEATITITVLALAVGAVLANWGTSAADLRRVAGQLSGTVRASYDEAALTGRTVRLAFSFEKAVIQVEATEAVLSFDDDAKPLARGAALAQTGGSVGPSLAGFALAGAALEKADNDENTDEETPSALTALLGLSKQIDHDEQGPAFESLNHDLALGEGVRLLDVWLQGANEPIKEGVAYLYFFPNGFTQDAVINLTNEEGAVFSVRIAALTGKTTVEPEYMELKK